VHASLATPWIPALPKTARLPQSSSAGRRQDPAAAREWVDSFRDGPLKKNAFEHIFAQSAAKMTTEEETAD
jgi:hypothetical protein